MSDALRRAISALSDVVCEARTTAEALDEVAGDNPPPLLSVFTTLMHRIHDASQAVELASNGVEADGGIGGVAPDAGDDWRHLFAPSNRGRDGGAAEPSSRPAERIPAA